MISAQWAYDIVQEFVYQFQSYCQNRSLYSRNPEDSPSSEIWSYSIVESLLRQIIEKATEQQPTVPPCPAHLHSLMAYFCRIELARMQCLLALYPASLETIQPVDLQDSNEFFTTVPSCHVNVFYHAAVSMLMTKEYEMALDTLSSIILHITRVLKPGGGSVKSPLVMQHQKMLDKIILLFAISTAICPDHRVDAQVVDIVTSKCSEKLRRLQSGDVGAFEDAFESACPKFISATHVEGGGSFDAWRTQIHQFMVEVKQQVVLMKLRSYLRLYSCIMLDKLARLNELSEEELMEKLAALSQRRRASTSEVSYRISNGKLYTENKAASTQASESTKYFFASCNQKITEHRAELARVFGDFQI